MSRWKQFFNRFGSRRCQIDDRTRFEPIGRDLYKYTEGTHVLWIGVEGLWGQPQYAIFASKIEKWRPPHENEMLTPEDKERILRNVCSFFDKQGITYKIS